MHDLLQDPPAWYVLGPLVGLVLVGLLAFVNVRMGVLGGWSDVIERASGRTPALGWKGWFVLGIVLGGLLFRLLAGVSTTGEGTGWAGRAFGDDGTLVVAAVLVGAGALVGFGAKSAGGCTSGNGLSGASFGSPGGMVAMATFMGTAIVASFLLEAIS
ncbi:YeeE/YedE family protein [Conexibacter sp. SYSU D00693]|uniref:YeeE/YedE family protein n=1 Tax=Conexibacter sp. SYSU D00693 TaxID=2812560 RepID=UPI00196AD710|nr:YeeE/YedE thiosulfate transporter family protein [Conexibacter sp. SYSU D00693]